MPSNVEIAPGLYLVERSDREKADAQRSLQETLPALIDSLNLPPSLAAQLKKRASG